MTLVMPDDAPSLDQPLGSTRLIARAPGAQKLLNTPSHGTYAVTWKGGSQSRGRGAKRASERGQNVRRPGGKRGRVAVGGAGRKFGTGLRSHARGRWGDSGLQLGR